MIFKTNGEKLICKFTVRYFSTLRRLRMENDTI